MVANSPKGDQAQRRRVLLLLDRDIQVGRKTLGQNVSLADEHSRGRTDVLIV
jgi:hypothetical protein